MRGAEKLGQAITWLQVLKIISKYENIDGFCSPPETLLPGEASHRPFLFTWHLCTIRKLYHFLKTFYLLS